jgi:hypothetical protein
MLARFLGFWVSLLISRQLGVPALGVYSGVLITTASPTTPTSAAMANSVTMMAAHQERGQSLWPLLFAQRWLLLLSWGVSCLGAYVMLRQVGLYGTDLLPAPLVLLVVVGLVAGQLLTQVVQSAYYGADLTLQASRFVCGVTVLAIVLSWPVMSCLGLSGLLVQAMLVSLLPGSWLAFSAWRRAHGTLWRESAAALHGQSWALLGKALPSIGATFLNNATNWLACIYLVERYQGRVGLGLVSLGLQWMAVMLLPMSSWSGRIMRSLTLAHQVGELAFWSEVRRQVRKCLFISIAAAALVVAALVPIGMLYRVSVDDILGIFLINAVACVLSSATFVYERVFYCLAHQRPWLWLSFLAYMGQLILTALCIPYTILAVPLGNLFAIVFLIWSVTIYLKRYRLRQV